MKALKSCLIAGVLMTLLGGRLSAEHPAGPARGPGCEDPYGPPKCKTCGKKVCHAEPTTEKVKKVVYDVECKEVCIPKVSFSLFGKKCSDCDCTAHCGKVRKVRVLVRKEIEVEVCKCKWKITDCPEPCAAPCQTGACVGGGCAAPGPHPAPPVSTLQTLPAIPQGPAAGAASPYAPELIAAPRK